MPREIKVHHFLPASYSNGPGLRAVVWVQGCTLGCPECYNPLTHSHSDGFIEDVSTLAQRIGECQGIQGLTISGGEPFQQIEAISDLCQLVRQQTDLSIIVFTGFEMEEINRIPHAATVLDNTDVLIAGRYRKELHMARDLRGSSNKQLIFLTPRYTLNDFTSLPTAEVIITPQGEMIYTGIDPLQAG